MSDEIKTEKTNEFVPTWPMYFVSIQTSFGKGEFLVVDLPVGRSVPIFTESLLAERYRDAKRPSWTVRAVDPVTFGKVTEMLHSQSIAFGYLVDELLHELLTQLRGRVDVDFAPHHDHGAVTLGAGR